MELVIDKWIYRSEKIENITQAMIKFQASIGSTLTKADQGQFAYAKLETILYCILPKLHDCGISLEQGDLCDGDDIYLRTAVTHTSGEFKASFDYLYPKDIVRQGVKSVQDAGNTQKVLGTIKTYQCRYALKNFLCLPIVDEDFDESKYITKIQQLLLRKMANDEVRLLDLVKQECKVKELKNILKDDFDTAITTIAKDKEWHSLII